VTSHPERLISRSLSGFLCGTHSGLRQRGSRRLDPDRLGAAHRELEARADSRSIRLGEKSWQPEPGARRLRNDLRAALANEHVVELVLFGSQAHGGTTGFSDVDAVLVITDDAADDPGRLRDLRPTVLAAQRAVLAHQPMQHHGFEVATPRLMTRAEEALALPQTAITGARSLNGQAVDASFSNSPRFNASEMLRGLAVQALAVGSWPRHPWDAHKVVSTFELLPTAYLQAGGTFVPKSASFDTARADLRTPWWPYDALREVRDRWPEISAPELRVSSAVLRNPWLAVAGWRRLPRRLPPSIRGLLSSELLAGLRGLTERMREADS
jgi:hypothetical protein